MTRALALALCLTSPALASEQWCRMMDNPAYDLGEMVSEFDAIVSTTLAELKEQE